MSVENAIYQFLDAAVLAAAPAASISGAIVHADTYEEILNSPTNTWIRVDDVFQSTPQLTGTGAKEFNAFVEIQCVARPEKQTNLGRRDARAQASRMALEVHVLIMGNRSLGTTDDSICDVTVTNKRNEWRVVGTVRHAASFLLLRVNPQ